MEKVTIKNLIEFRGKNERTKITFVNNLKKPKLKLNDDSGGDYWISCLSAIRNTFKFNNEDLLDEKIDLLYYKIGNSDIPRIKNQFQRNIDILSNFKDFDFQHLKPKVELNFLKQPKNYSLIYIEGLPIEAKPCHIYTFSQNGSEEIGGVWFVAKLGGFRKRELGMFADLLYRYLKKHFEMDFYINSKYCIAIDLYNGLEVSYSNIENGDIPILIEKTINEIKKI